MDKILKITDNGGKTTDRYTVYFSDGYMLMMSPNAGSPQGVCMSDTWKQEYIDNDNGTEMQFDDLPEQVQKAIIRFMNE